MPIDVDAVRVAVTLGDPRGIGPEVVAEAVERLRDERPDIEPILLGSDGDLVSLAHRFRIEAVGEFDGSLTSAGELSLAALRRGVEMSLAGDVSALVTGPVHKPALHAAGVRAPGQTELLQEWTGARTVGMLMASESTRAGVPLRILLATTHLPLREVPAAVTEALLDEQTSLLHEELRLRWGMERPRIALCALNPHASDSGLFGDEEERVFAPAMERLQERGLDVTGPFPADTVFLLALEGTVDAVVVPYHDVGMAVFKTLAFGRGVNVTLGLPFVRTSPDHGTAFDLVGTGRADATSTLEALRLAGRLCRPRPDSTL